MDFSLSEEQQAAADLAARIFDDQLTSERFRAVDAEPDRFDRAVWSALAHAGLLGLSLPAAYGGAGLGFLETALVLEQAGRAAAPVPLLATVVLGALPVARFGSPTQQAAVLPAVIAGELILTAALIEPGGEPSRPLTTARREGDAWRLDGAKTCVPAAPLAGRILVPADIGGGEVGVFVVDPATAGVTLTRLITTTRDPEGRLELDAVAVGADTLLGTPADGAAIVEWIVTHATAALCSEMAGLCRRVVTLTAEYTRGREQFDRPIATFQAVGQRAADAFVDAQAIELTARQAAWRLSEGLEADDEVAIAKFWAAEAGQRVVHAAQHLHGGMGVDRDYPLHRYFLRAKQLELSLGGATPQLLRLGASIARQSA